MARRSKNPRDEVHDPDELALVRKAFGSGLSNCVMWKDDRTMRRVEAEGLGETGLTAVAVKKMTIDHVNQGGEIYQIEEKRVEFRQFHPFWYKILVTVNDIEKSLFVEAILHDDDQEFPVVLIVNAHF